MSLTFRPKSIVEGRGVKVYRLPEKQTFAIFESWGWEDVWEDMMSDESIRRLRRDVVRLLRDGTPLSLIEDNLDHLIDKASTRLTTEEKVVFLKWLEKNKQRLTPELGLDAYKRQSDKRWGIREKEECPICGGEGVAPIRGNPTDPANQEAVAKCWKCKGEGYLKEAKYYRPIASGWDRESKKTDSRLSPAQRGQIAASADTSLDWNDETEEYNPYPIGTDEFEEYEKAYEQTYEEIRHRFPHI